MAALNTYGISHVNCSLEATMYLPFPLSSIHVSLSVFLCHCYITECYSDGLVQTIKSNVPTYLLTYLLHGAESFLRSSRNSPAFYGTRRFITTLTSVRHLSLSCASPIQSTYPHPTSWRSILISNVPTHK